MKDLKIGDEVVCIDSSNWAVDNDTDCKINPGPIQGEICVVNDIQSSLVTDVMVLGLDGYKYGSNMKPIYYYASKFIKVIRTKHKTKTKIKQNEFI